MSLSPNAGDPQFAPPDPDAPTLHTCDECGEEVERVYPVHVPSVAWQSPAYLEHHCADCIGQDERERGDE